MIETEVGVGEEVERERDLGGQRERVELIPFRDECFGKKAGPVNPFFFFFFFFFSSYVFFGKKYLFMSVGVGG